MYFFRQQFYFLRWKMTNIILWSILTMLSYSQIILSNNTAKNSSTSNSVSAENNQLQGCQIFDVVRGGCQSCIAGWLLLSDSQCYMSPFFIPGCLVYNREDITSCTICDQQHTLFQTQCYPCTNCPGTDWQNSTANITLLTVDGIWEKQIQHCNNYNTTGIQKYCVQCQIGYSLKKGLCALVDPLCDRISSDGTCLSCSNGLVPFLDRCVFYDPFCLAYNASGFCILPDTHFTLSHFDPQSYRTVIFSQAYSVGGTAVFIFGDNLISQLDSAVIKTYDWNGKILSCQMGYELVNDQCVNFTSNCYAYNAKGTCQYCQQGFDLVQNNKCIQRSASTCLFSQGQGGVQGGLQGGVQTQIQPPGPTPCLLPADGFITIDSFTMFAGQHIVNTTVQVQNASKSYNQILSAPANGYFFRADSVQRIAWPLDNNCLRQNFVGRCGECAMGYQKVNGSCIHRKDHCIAYGVYGVCQTCEQGYQLFASSCRKSQCSSPLINNTCFQCPFDFIPYLSTCLSSLQPFCLIYNATNNNCLRCQEGHYLTYNMNQTVNPDATVTNNNDIPRLLCYPIEIPNCLLLESNLTQICTKCKSGYDLVENKCVKFVEGCTRMSGTQNVCQQCNVDRVKVGLGNLSVLCAVKVNGCANYSSDLKCSQCVRNYTLFSNACIFQCQTASCDKCKSPYILTANRTCADPKCFNWSQTTNTCLQCKPSFTINDRSQLCQRDLSMAYCTQFNGDTCTACSPIKLFLAGYCVDFYYQCLQFDMNWNCVKCINGMLPIFMKCYPKVDRCTRYSFTGICTACQNNTTLDQLRNVCIQVKPTPIKPATPLVRGSSIKGVSLITSAGPLPFFPAINSSKYFALTQKVQTYFIVSFQQTENPVKNLRKITLKGHKSGYLNSFYLSSRQNATSVFGCVQSCRLITGLNNPEDQINIPFNGETFSELMITAINYVGDMGVQIQVWVDLA